MNGNSEHVPNESKLTLIFIYGTLKCRLSNHRLMAYLIARDDAVFLGNYVTLQPCPLVREGIPYLINLPGRGYRVRGELYSVMGRGLAPLDELEGVAVGHYERLPIHVISEAGRHRVIMPAEAYFAHRSFGETLWARNHGKGLSEYTERGRRTEVCEKTVLASQWSPGFLRIFYVSCMLSFDESAY